MFCAIAITRAPQSDSGSYLHPGTRKPTSFQDMYALAMTIDHRYWERDHERHYVRQAEKEALESHS